jgi:DNA-binding NarL/FixJ family response regulator
MKLTKIRVAIAEDKKQDIDIIKKAFRELLNYEIVLVATGGIELITKLDKLNKLPDLVLMDMQMPCCDGLLATTICRRLFTNNMKIVGLSTHTYAPVIVQFMAEGGDSFLSKFIVQKDSAISLSHYKNPNIFEEALEQIMIQNKIYFDTLSHYNGEDYTKLNTTKKIISKEYSHLLPKYITLLQLNAAGFSQVQSAKLLNIGVSTVKKYLADLFEIFEAKNHNNLANVTAMLGITKNVTLYQAFD